MGCSTVHRTGMIGVVDEIALDRNGMGGSTTERRGMMGGSVLMVVESCGDVTVQVTLGCLGWPRYFVVLCPKPYGVQGSNLTFLSFCPADRRADRSFCPAEKFSVRTFCPASSLMKKIEKYRQTLTEIY